MPNLFLLLNFAACVFMTGVIWFVQVVHYPLFASVVETGFSAYQRRNMRLTTFVVAPVMIIEALTAPLLLIYPPKCAVTWTLWLAAAYVVLIWLSTLLVQSPIHVKLIGRLTRNHKALLLTNWLRTVLWTSRSALLFTIVCLNTN